MKEQARNKLPIYLYHQGTNFRAHDFFGCHIDQDTAEAAFRVWAPDAQEICVLGDWNNWTEDAHPMVRISDDGVWEVSVQGVALWQRYKFSILGQDGIRRLKSDPFAFHAETDGLSASIVCDITGYSWGDEAWMEQRQKWKSNDKPMNIYELHVGSWRKHPDGRVFSYTELADQLVPYLKDMAYTHLELMPVMEHPSLQSQGYQITGYFAPTSRYGAPQELMTLIDRCHQAGIAVFLDWVPVYFPKDAQGLVEFDGAALYEKPELPYIKQQEWGNCYFDYARAEVQSFLISNAIFWLETYHGDGLRLDSVSSMLYLDHRKNVGSLVSNPYGSNENLDAITFLRKLNRAVTTFCPGTVMIAEEESAWPMLTIPVQEGGMGFQYKWNMGWTRDMMDYMSVDPDYRRMIHDKITFPLYYTFHENYILPVSHEEAARGKRSLLDKMQGEYEWKFAGVRAFLGYMIAHPGKKHNFMGYEIGQFREWDMESSIDWMLLDFPAHQQLQTYVKALNRFYLDTPALWELDHSWAGFEWISTDDNTQNVILFMRKDTKDQFLVVLQNFAPRSRENYRFGVPVPGTYKEIFNSDDIRFGGWGYSNEPLRAETVPMHGFPYSIAVCVPPLSTVFFQLSS